eukprot:SAG31_NODE_12828_length_913_cov_13.321867_1_plen_67_part_00
MYNSTGRGTARYPPCAYARAPDDRTRTTRELVSIDATTGPAGWLPAAGRRVRWRLDCLALEKMGPA